MKRRKALHCTAALALLLALGGCATGSGGGATPRTDAAGTRNQWSGRMALRLDSAPPQSFSALFELRGSARTGELTLTSPIGNTLGLARWAPGQAELLNGSQTRRFDSADALIEAATGAAIPLDALFAWLAGQERAVPGWRADLSQVGTGRLQAVRNDPQPQADLRIVFDAAP